MNVPKYDESLVKVSGPPPEPKPLLSAREKVAADVIVPTKPDLTPTTSQLDREMRSGNVIMNLPVPELSDRTVFLRQAISLGLGSEDSCVMEAPNWEPQPLRLWPDADERNRLLEITQQIIDGNQFVADNFSQAAALAKFHSQRDATEKSAATGQLDQSQFHKSLQAYQDDFRVRHLAAEKVWVSLTKEAAPVMRKALERAVAILHGALVYLEFIGREEAASFGITWKPSPLYLAIARTMVNFSLKKDPAPGASVLPTHHLDGLLEIDL